MKTLRLALIFSLSFFYSLASYSQGVKPGDIAPNFALKNIDGKIVSLGDYKNAKGVILIFTCNHCPYSIAYEDRIIALDKKFKPLGWPLVAINPNDPSVQPLDSFEKMQERAAEKGFTFPYLFDEGQKIFPQYGASKTRMSFFCKTSKANLWCATLALSTTIMKTRPGQTVNMWKKPLLPSKPAKRLLHHLPRP